MTKKGLGSLNASQLRIMLVASIIGIIVLIGIGFYFIQAQLYSFAVVVSHANEDATTSRDDISIFEKLQQQLADDDATVKRAQDIVADSKQYEYQNQIIVDLNTYAARSGISIASFTFDDNGAQTPGASALPPSTTGVRPKVSITGLKSTTVSISLKTPTKYRDLMNFVHSIEKNLTKMQLASFAATKGEKADEVAINTLEIEVYIK
jgi:hypothetical protein